MVYSDNGRGGLGREKYTKVWQKEQVVALMSSMERKWVSISRTGEVLDCASEQWFVSFESQRWKRGCVKAGQ